MGMSTLVLFHLIFKLLLGLFSVSILGWDILLLFFAEIGRRDDLRRATTKTPPPFRFAIVIALLTEMDKPALNQLIDVLLHQTPAQPRQPDIYIVSPEAIHSNLVTISRAFPESVHFLPCPDLAENLCKRLSHNEQIGRLHAWGAERLLALGGNTRLFVFLEATDIIRPDYLQQIALKAAYHPVLQGYQAMKKLDEDMTSRNIGLKQRLLNRIEQAGRFHLGLSAILQPTGWCIHQDVLEKVPMDRFLINYPKAYGMILNRVGYRIQWAPNIVTYKEEAFNFWQYLDAECLSAISQIRLFLSQLPQTIHYIIARRQPMVGMSQLWNILPLPHAYMGILLLFAWCGMSNTPYAGFVGAVFWGYVVLQAAKLFVARIRFQDTLFCSGLVIWYRFISLILLPFVAIKLFFANSVSVQNVVSLTPKNGLYNFSQTTRKLQLPSILLTDKAWEDTEQKQPLPSSEADPINLKGTARPEMQNHNDSVAIIQNNNKPAITAQLTNGDKILDCLILVHEIEDGLPGFPSTKYQLQLSHRGNTFSTEYFHDKDEAFAALQDKLGHKGFKILLDSRQVSV